MEFKKIWNYIVSIKTNIKDIDKINIQKVLESIGNPQHSYKTIHIGGTNGKGSTSNFIYTYLKTKFKTGLFISPSVIFEMELARVNDTFISKEEFTNLYLKHEEIIKKYNLTFFEIKTLIAFCWFKNQKTQYVIIEVGLGGIYDATNTLKPEACVITNIGDDHVEYLGNTFESKAKNKLGIQQKGIPLFTSESKIIEYSKYPEDIILNNYEFYFEKFPKYQKHNYNLAIQLLIKLGFDKENIVTVIKKTKLLPYRFEKIKSNIYFDAAHNVHGTEALIETINFQEENIFIISTQKNKDYLSMIKKLKKHGEVYLINFNFENLKISFDAKKIAQKTNTKFLKNINDLEINLNKNYIFTGSFYFLKSIRNNV